MIFNVVSEFWTPLYTVYCKFICSFIFSKRFILQGHSGSGASHCNTAHQAAKFTPVGTPFHLRASFIHIYTLNHSYKQSNTTRDSGAVMSFSALLTLCHHVALFFFPNTSFNNKNIKQNNTVPR